MAKISAFILVVLLAAPAAALAQDFGTEWMDRVTHERLQDRGPLKPVPVAVTLSGGLAFYHDDNLFLEDGSEDDDNILIPFVGARVDYAEPEFEVAADLLANYKRYFDDSPDNHSDYEQRFYGRARYLGARMNLELVQLLQNLSDPTDVVFANRIERTVSDTTGRFAWDITRTVAFEAAGHLQVVRFEDKVPSIIENNNLRADGSIVYRVPNGFDWVFQGGYLLIDYEAKQSRGGAPDAEGWYGRLGFRGEPNERLRLEALLGFAGVQSSKFLGTAEREEMNTAEAIVRSRFQVVEQVAVTADFSRLVGFAGITGVGGNRDPFQIVNRVTAWVDIEPAEKFAVRPRVQYDRAMSSLGIDRDFLALGISATYQVLDQPSLVVDAGLTWREGETAGDVVLAQEFENLIFHAGFVVTY